MGREAVTGVTRVTAHPDTVIRLLAVNPGLIQLSPETSELTERNSPPELVILSPGRLTVEGLQLHPEPHVLAGGQGVEELVAEPELPIEVSEAVLVVLPVPGKVLPPILKRSSPLNDLKIFF